MVKSMINFTALMSINCFCQLRTETTLVRVSEVGELTTFSSKMDNHVVEDISSSIGNRYFKSKLFFYKTRKFTIFPSIKLYVLYLEIIVLTLL